MKRKIFSTLFALVLVLSFSLVMAAPAMATGENPTAPDLGEAGRFVILASQTVTTTGTTAISDGDIGIIDQARTYITGFTPTGPAGDFTELTNGTSYASDDANPAPFPYPLKYATPVIGEAWATTGAMITQVRTDLGVAYDFLAADPNPTAPTQVCPIELGGETLTRGVYKTAANVLITTGPLHLDAQGDPDSVWIFSIDGTLTVGAPSGAVILENEAQAKNVYWRTAGVTSIEAGRTFYGNVFAWEQVNVLDGADIMGRLFSVNEQVTLIANTVTMPAVAVTGGTTTTLTVPDNVYRPAEFVASSTTTNSGTAYDHVRFNITVDGPVDFAGDRADTFTITKVNGSDTEGINDTFVLVGGDWVGYWGPVGGFLLPAPYEATSTFTVQMCDDGTAPLGDYEVTVELVDIDNSSAVLATATDGFTLSLEPSVINFDTGEGFNSIQSAIDAAGPGNTINVAAGTYDEQVEISDSLTLIGSGDATVIQPSGADILTTVLTTPWIGSATKQMAAIVFVDTATTVTVMDLKIDGSLITEVPAGVGGDWVAGLAYLETSGTVEGLTVIGDPSLGCRTAGIWASAVTETALVEVTGCNVIGYNRAGIYAVGGTLTADYNWNKIYGPGELITQVPNGIYFLRNAKGSATYNIVTDLAYTGEQYLSTGIGVYEAGADIIFSHNEISNVQMAFCLAKDSSGTIVENNDIHDCHTGVKIEFGAASHTIRYNDIHDNDFAIRCDDLMGDGNVAHFNNFVNNSGAEWTNVGEGRTYVGAVCNLHEEYGLDAGMNWWGHISGPEYEAASFEDWPNNPGGIGDSVSDNVNFVPWLTREFQTVLDDNIAYIGYPMVWLNTGWNTLSTPIALDPGCDTWGDYVALGDTLNIHATSPAYAFNPTATVPWVQLTDAYLLKPCDAIYVRMAGPDIAAILFSPNVSVPTKQLYAGWNLVGLAWLSEGEEYAMPANEALVSVHEVSEGLTGYVQVVSPPVNQAPWIYTGGDIEDWIDPPPGGWMEMTNGYWVFMLNDGTLAGFTFTPMSLD